MTKESVWKNLSVFLVFWMTSLLATCIGFSMQVSVWLASMIGCGLVVSGMRPRTANASIFFSGMFAAMAFFAAIGMPKTW